MTEALLERPGEAHRPGSGEFRERFARAAGVVNAAEAALVELTAEALRAGFWDVAGIHTPAQWLAWQAGVAPSTATRVLRVARRAHELPTTMGLFTKGALSLDQATTVARFTPADYEQSVCELAVNATVAQIVAATKQYSFDLDQADRDANPDRRRRAPERSVACGCDAGDQWSARVRLPVDEGKVVEAALEAVRDSLHAANRRAAKEAAAAEGRATTGTDADLGVAPVDNADALVGMAHAALTDATGCDVATRPGVLLHLEAPEPGAEGAQRWRAEMHMGPGLPDGLRRLLLCDCDIAVVWERDSVPVATARTQRTVPRGVRRLIEHRDGGCVVPGCGQRTHLDVHHIVHWEDDGETISVNLCCLCHRHHRMHHMGMLGIVGDADVGLVFTDAEGRVLDAASSPVWPQPADMPVVEPYDGPTGERLQRRWVDFTRTRARPPDEGAPSG